MLKIKESNFAKAQFIIIGMISIIISLIIPESVTIEAFSNKPFSLMILINIFNAIGSILIVGRGIFEVIFKDQFIKEVSKDFIKALFLDRSSLGHFNSEDLQQMQINTQGELLGLENRHFKTKFMKMINNSFFKIAQGVHEN